MARNGSALFALDPEANVFNERVIHETCYKLELRKSNLLSTYPRLLFFGIPGDLILCVNVFIVCVFIEV